MFIIFGKDGIPVFAELVFCKSAEMFRLECSPRKRGLGTEALQPNGKAAALKCSQLLRPTRGVKGSRLLSFSGVITA